MEHWPTRTALEWFERLEDVKRGNFSTLIRFLRQHGLNYRARIGELADALEAYEANKNRTGRPPTRRLPLADLLGYADPEAVSYYRNLRMEGNSDNMAGKLTRAKFKMPTTALNEAIRKANVKRRKQRSSR